MDIVPGQRQIVARRGQDTFALKYDKLVIAAGGAPAATIPGADGPGGFHCNDMAGALALRKFLEERDKVRISVVFYGREMEHKDIGHGLLARMREQLGDIFVEESSPNMLGNRMHLMLAPKK